MNSQAEVSTPQKSTKPPKDTKKYAKRNGICVIDDCKVDKDQIKRVRLINLLEPFIVYGITLATVWGTGMDESNPFLYPILGILVIWILFVSPWWHYEKLNEKEIFLYPDQRNLGFWYLECRGLGSPKKYWQKDEDGVRGFVKHKDAIIKMLVLWDICILTIPYAFEGDYQEIILDLFGSASVGYQ